MIGVLFEPAKYGVARIAHRNFANQEIRQKIDKGRQAKSGHGCKRLPLREKVEAGDNTHSDDHHSYLPVEVLLYVQIVMAAGRASCYYPSA